jgi:mannose-6-phosphate isomerase-like protein (cupin superfamily)
MAYSHTTAAPLDLRRTYLHFDGQGGAAPIPVTPDFWPEVTAGTRTYDGRLVTAFHLTEDMEHWEMHPEGDEVLILLSGAVEVVLDAGQGEERLALAAGQACVVPRGAWHRIVVREAGDLIFVTWGAGTRHRPL